MLSQLAAALGDRYQLDREIGAGGMATVYLARDLRHDRQVAVKVLRPELAAVIGIERFLAEIRTTANLQHPHILTVLDSGKVEVEGRDLLYYTMPFVEGESLRSRLTREKQLPVGDAVRIGSEVAAALDYAHRHGVIHRDIKPENILLHDGSALVADFGIALAASKAGGSRMTETGMSLGTPTYMSPEQAMGEREINARSDVYALGATTYEMLVGEPPFTGPTAQAIVAKVMTADPASITSQRRSVPPHVDAAVLTALEKLPADRWATAADFAAALEGRTALASRPRERPDARRTRRRDIALLAMTALVAAALGVIAGRRSGPAAPALPPTRLSIMTQGVASAGSSRQLDISPDGEALAFDGRGPGGEGQLMYYRFDVGEPMPLPGTEAGIDPHFTPDGEIQFGGGSGTMTVHPTAGGAPAVRRGRLNSTFMAWASDGTVWLTELSTGQVVGMPPAGAPVRFPADSQTVSGVQQVLPGDRYALVVELALGAVAGRLVALDLESGKRTPLLDTPVVEARYAVGVLVVARTSGALEALRFDAARLRTAGRPVVIASDVALSGIGIAQLALAANGTLAYLPVQPSELVLGDRRGVFQPLSEARHNWHSPRFSPDGRRISVDFATEGGRDVWIVDRDEKTLTRTTFTRDGHDAEWSPDGRSLAFTTFPAGRFQAVLARPGSTARPDSLFAGDSISWTGTWLPDGSGLVSIAVDFAGTSGYDIVALRRPDWRPVPLIATQFAETSPSVAPDGRWVAYASNASGRSEVYVTPIGGQGEQLLVSRDGGTDPIWSRDGREIFYRRPTGSGRLELVAAAVSTAPAFRVTNRTALFDASEFNPAQPHSNYDVSPDGQNFVFVRRSATTRIVVIQNLPELVRRLGGQSE